MRRVVMFGVLVAAGGCKLTDADHCRWRGEHVFCAANFADAPYCSPCEPAAEMSGCVAEIPSEDACPDFEPPATSEGSGTSSSTDASSSGASSSDESTAATMPATESTSTNDASSSSEASASASSSGESSSSAASSSSSESSG